MSDWYARGRAGLVAWAESCAVGTRADVATSPLARALDCVDAADELLRALNDTEHVDPQDLQDAIVAYQQARSRA